MRRIDQLVYFLSVFYIYSCPILYTNAFSSLPMSRINSIQNKLLCKNDNKKKTKQNFDEDAFYVKRFEKLYKDALLIINGTNCGEVSRQEELTPIILPEEYCSMAGVLQGDRQVNFSCEVFKSSKLEYIRRVSFHGSGYHILNMLAIPKASFNIPILGIDVVVLPGCTLANIDYQPIFNNEDYYGATPIYSNANRIKLKKWSSLLPSGGPLPESAREFFSPLCLWTRFQSQKSGALLYLLEQALQDYVTIYTAELLNCSQEESNISMQEKRRHRIEHYLEYRIVNDPAKNMLNAAFGKKWTEIGLKSIIFPKEFSN